MAASFRSAILMALLCLWIGAEPGQAAGPAGESAGESDGAAAIVTVNIPYDLFLSMALYQELTEAEAMGRPVNGPLLPVLGQIIDALRGERMKFAHLPPTAHPDLADRLGRLDDLIGDFQSERLYRRKAMEMEQLIREQRRLLEGE